ncbi:glycosyltransferase family 4 protein [Angustibacter aerolatus]
MREYLFVLLVAAVVTYTLTPLVRTLAVRFGALTAVRERDVHAVPTPRLGGTAMFVGFAAAIAVASQLKYLSQVGSNHDLVAVLVGGGLVCLLGVVDDVWGLDPFTKLGGQVLAAGIMAAQGVQLLSIPLPGAVTYLPTPVLVVLTVVVVVTTMNAVNFVDGLDGLAAGIVGIAAIAFFGYSYSISKDFAPNVFSVGSLVAAALVGCCLGFLPHNFNPAKIFMGDSGAMLLGLLLSASTISLIGSLDPQSVGDERQQNLLYLFPLLMPLAVLVVPLLDLVLAVVRRTRAGKSPFHPDAKHLHHQLLALGHSHAGAVVVLYLWTAVVALGAASFALVPARYAVLVVVGLGLLALTTTLAGPLARRAGRRTATPRIGS